MFPFSQVAKAVLTSEQLKSHQEKPNFVIKVPKVTPSAHPPCQECCAGKPALPASLFKSFFFSGVGGCFIVLEILDGP